MKKKFYNCPSVEVTMVSSYGICQFVSKYFDEKELIEGNPELGL